METKTGGVVIGRSDLRRVSTVLRKVSTLCRKVIQGLSTVLGKDIVLFNKF